MPAWVSALKVSELARPLALVVAVHEATAVPPVARQVPPLVEAKTCRWPRVVAGAVKVTVAPETGLPKASVTWATSGLVKAVLTVVDWAAPEETAMVVAVPALLVSEKVGGVVSPEALVATADGTGRVVGGEGRGAGVTRGVGGHQAGRERGVVAARAGAEGARGARGRCGEGHDHVRDRVAEAVDDVDAERRRVGGAHA